NWQATSVGEESVAWQHGDINGDGIVDFVDFTTQNIYWQRSIAKAGSTAAVPEPSSWLLVVLAVTLWVPAVGKSRVA
ncbi:MAG: hypothetical protein KDB22_30085, partial [Planctomycetales bacterium]|nr:hypothetical protein [Planctomycetales bacterium]